VFNRFNIILLAGLVLFSLGCGLLSPKSTITPTPILSETAEQTPTTAAEEETESIEDVIPLPVMDDASDAEDFFGTYSYVTSYSVQEIVDFYKSELSALGMTLSSDTVGSDFAVLQFDQEGDIPLTLNVVTNDAGLREVRLTD